MKRSRGRPKKEQPPTEESDQLNFVSTWDDLAFRLKRSRRCLTKWRERFKDALDLPRPQADGRHDVKAWLQFMVDHDLADEAEDPEDQEETEAFWKRKNAKLIFERGQYAFEVEKGNHLETAEISAAVGQMLAGFRTAMNTLPGSAARWLVGLRDFHQIKDKLQSEVDAVLRALGRCDYLEPARVEAIAKSLPFDKETEALIAKITFAGQDRQLLNDLIARVALRAIEQFGRSALSDLLQRELSSTKSQSPAGNSSDAKSLASRQRRTSRRKTK